MLSCIRFFLVSHHPLLKKTEEKKKQKAKRKKEKTRVCAYHFYRYRNEFKACKGKEKLVVLLIVLLFSSVDWPD